MIEKTKEVSKKYAVNSFHHLLGSAIRNTECPRHVATANVDATLNLVTDE